MSYYICYVVPGKEPVDGDNITSARGLHDFGTWVLDRINEYPNVAHLIDEGWDEDLEDLEHELESILHEVGQPELVGVASKLLAELKARPAGTVGIIITDGEPGGGDEPAELSATDPPPTAELDHKPILDAYHQVVKDIHLNATPDRGDAEYMAGLLHGDPKWKQDKRNAEAFADLPSLRELHGSLPGTTPEHVLEAFDKRREQLQADSAGKPLDHKPQSWKDLADYHFHDWREKLPKAVKDAFGIYQNENYTAINQKLRTGKIPEKELASIAEENGISPEEVHRKTDEVSRHLDKAFESAPPLDRTATLYRDMGAVGGANSAGGRDLYAKLRSGDLKVGDTLTDKAFQSTSYNPFVPKSNKPALIMRIHTPAGVKAIPMIAAGHPDVESEVLLPRGARYTIRGVKHDGPVTWVDADYAHHHPDVKELSATPGEQTEEITEDVPHPESPLGVPGVIGEWASAKGRPKEHLEAALWNAGIEDPAKDTTGGRGINRRLLARRLVSVWHDLHGAGGTPEELAPVERALFHAGLERKHEAGEDVSFDGRYHEGPPGSFTGTPARVVRPGWVLPEPDGREYIVSKAATGPRNG